MAGNVPRAAKILLGLGPVLLAWPSSSLQAAGGGDWAGQRQVRFAEWQKGHRGVDTAISRLKSETAALVQQHKAQEQARLDRERAEIIARSKALSADQVKQADDLLAQAAAAAKSGNCDSAIPEFKRALDIDPASGPATLGIGECLLKQGKPAEASEYLTRTTRLPVLRHETEMAQLRAMVELQSLLEPHDPKIDEPPVIFRVSEPPKEVWDSPEAPVMTIIPAGEYTMGAPPTEQYYSPSESQHRVKIGYPIAFSKYNVTRGEFAAFVAATGYVANNGDGCNTFTDGMFKRDPKADWRSPGFEQSDDDPVVCVNYYDAVAYADWLTKKTGHVYRLPSEAEWEYAVRAGTTTIYYWGTEIGKGHANCDGCNSASDPKKTTPGGTFPPNAFGLYDMSGNVWKWLADCWNRTYDGAPTDGSAWNSGNCALRGRRTGSWFNLVERKSGDPREPGRLRAAGRFGSIPELRYASFGFRVVREL